LPSHASSTAATSRATCGASAPSIASAATPLDELLPAARWQGAAAGLHLHVALPADVDERALTLAAYARGVLVEDGSWHWASPEHAPPSIMIGYGSMTRPSIRQAISILADAMTRR
jgi:DNA-binding transcriptional MocR family regulator